MSKTPTAHTPQQELAAALDSGNVAQAATAAMGLARSGELPIIELFTVAQKLADAQRADQAIALYRLWLARTSSPLSYAVQFNLAVTLSNARDEAGAEQAYRAALAIKPDFIEALLNLGTLLERQKLPDHALATWREAADIMQPRLPAEKTLYVQALNNLGRLLEIQKRLPEAGVALGASLEQDPKQPNVITHWVHLRQKQCEWPIYADIGGIPTQDLIDATSALATLSASNDPATQLAAARRYVNEKVLTGVAPLAKADGYGHRRLRIGYLSSDFCSHAISILTAELYGLHDRNRVEVFGFCWSNDDGSQLRARVIAGMDHHIRIGQMSDEEAAKTIRAREIDVLIDLHGLTLGTRTDILSYRPAPVQITWLGLPGPTGLPAIDYVLSDRFVLPPELEPFFTEKPLHLPNTFQVNDRQRPIGPTPSKESCGLPEDAFIFCSFNNNHKFTPEVFSAWMRILKRAPHSVLWVVADTEQVRENLAKAAEADGVPRSRLMFGGRVMPADYMARFRVADLFLDTLPFNGGTTASDALWAGLPLLTCVGKTFAARMAGSLLQAADLPELITYNLQDYEDLAVELAHNPARIALYKQRLVDNHLSCALFDTPRLVRDLEDAYFSVAIGCDPDAVEPDAPVAPARSVPSLPLVSILIPTHNRPHLFEIALKSALAQTYENCEIVISDNSDDTATAAVVNRYIQRYPKIKYYYRQAMPSHDNWKACLDMAAGEYVNYLMDDDVFHPEKIARMMQCFLLHPQIGLVTSYRQLIDGDGNHIPQLPGTERMFPIDTLVTGKSFGNMILANGTNLIGEPTTVLLRRADVGPHMGRFLGKTYVVLSDIATWLSVLADRDCIYLTDTLSYFRIHGAQDQRNSTIPIKASMEWFQMSYDAYKRNLFFDDRAGFRQRLADKLSAFTAHISANYQQIRDGGYDIEEIHQTIRLGYQIVLAD